jgi:spore coat polysaccharide biosynthesis protein SpsF
MILAILQARMSSTRLPGKVLKILQGKPMISHQIDRILKSKKIDKLIIATSNEKSDDSLETIAKNSNVDYFRGSLKNVLTRFYNAAFQCQPKHIVRLTGDCPLSDPEIIDQVISFYLSGNYDYVSNSVEATFPDGLDVEIFSFQSLQEAFNEAQLPSQREHVTPFINSQPDRYQLGCFKQSIDLSHLRWTVDEPEDFEFVSEVFKSLYPKNPDFGMHDILNLIENNPEIASINKQFKRNEGLQKSLDEDQQFIS